MATLQTGTPQHATPQRFDPHTAEQFRFDPHTGEPIGGPPRASFGLRGAAVAIDYIVGLPVLLIPAGFGLIGTSDADAFAASFVLYLFLYPIYYALAEGLLGGRTLGKALVGIAVTRPDGSPAGLGRTFGRELVRWVMVLLWIMPLVDHLAALRHDRRTLHDRIAKTLVIERDVSDRGRWVTLGVIGGLIVLAAFAIGWSELA